MEKDKEYKKNLLWNMIASAINAAEAVIIIMVASRINELGEVGVLTIAFSIANLFMMIGKFGVKNYQVSHDGYDASFSGFVRLRILTVIMMTAALAGYLGVNVYMGKYTPAKALVIAGVCIWYTIEAFEDVFVVHMQTLGKLHVGNKIFIIRWCLIFAVMIGMDIVTRNLILSIASADAVALMAEIICLVFISNKYNIKGSIRGISIINLLIANVPLCISEVSYFYINNVPKFVIDRKMDDATQAIYGYVSVPVFVISLVNSIIYQPLLMGYVMDIREHRMGQFIRKILRQIAIIAGIMLVCLLGAYILGIQVLSILYGMDLRPYKMMMVMLLAGGGALAVGGFLETILVIMNRRKTAMTIYLIVAAISTVITVLLVNRYSLWGAVYGFVLTMCIMAVLFASSLAVAVKRIMNGENTLTEGTDE